ncbi:HflK protein [Chromatiales bacterium (ex Bugula neritina AB1)]|nr:HflK protein [Chromatiales bacterium (ex Bugula neritina AB1)]
MAWNEPGGNNNDPWGNKKNDSGPPDLDEVFRNLQKKLDGLFGGKRGGGTGGGGPGFPGKLGSIGLLLIALVVVAVWLSSGIYIIQPAERGVVLQFGRYATTTQPGPHWHIPWPVQTLERVNVDQNRSVELRSQEILTKDENIVEIDLAVQYNIKGAQEYLFNVTDPDTTLRQAAESALRETVGQTVMDLVLTEGRGIIATETKDKIQETLDSYEAGVLVTAVNLESAQPPEAVQAAFSDAIKAREDQERFINESEAYKNGLLPQARGDAVIALEEARAYKSQVVNAAQGEAARFESLLTEYAKAPEITKTRLYLESLESVLSSSSKVMVDVEGGNNLMYLPLDKLMGGGGGTPQQPALDQIKQGASQFTTPQASGSASRINNSRSRSRDAQ